MASTALLIIHQTQPGQREAVRKIWLTHMQMGIESLAHLARANAADILARGAQLTGSSCWKNSPQARAAVASAIEAAQQAQSEAS